MESLENHGDMQIDDWLLIGRWQSREYQLRVNCIWLITDSEY